MMEKNGFIFEISNQKLLKMTKVFSVVQCNQVSKTIQDKVFNLILLQMAKLPLLLIQVPKNNFVN